jgi:hypothetical protein
MADGHQHVRASGRSSSRSNARESSCAAGEHGDREHG